MRVTRAYSFVFDRACKSFSLSGMHEVRIGPTGNAGGATSDCGVSGSIDAVTVDHVELSGQRIYLTRSACETGRAAVRRGEHTSYVLPQDGC